MPTPDKPPQRKRDLPMTDEDYDRLSAKLDALEESWDVAEKAEIAAWEELLRG